MGFSLLNHPAMGYTPIYGNLHILKSPKNHQEPRRMTQDTSRIDACLNMFETTSYSPPYWRWHHMWPNIACWQDRVACSNYGWIIVDILPGYKCLWVDNCGHFARIYFARIFVEIYGWPVSVFCSFENTLTKKNVRSEASIPWAMASLITENVMVQQGTEVFRSGHDNWKTCKMTTDY